MPITGGGYGSSFPRDPNKRNVFYGLTDRGPNVDGPKGTKIEPLPDFTPAIGQFRLVNGRADLLSSIPLKAGDGQRYNGQVICPGEHWRDPSKGLPNGQQDDEYLAVDTAWIGDPVTSTTVSILVR